MLINPLLTREILEALCVMRHGDEVILVDTFYPADTAARSSTIGNLLRVDAAGSAQAVRAVRVYRRRRQTEILPHVTREVQVELDRAQGNAIAMAPISRKAFYERAQKGYCVIVTGETRAWGNFILRKGITVTPDALSADSNSHVCHFEWTGVGNLSS